MLTHISLILGKVVNRIMNMSAPKGGRGNKAPYETTHVRVPVPIKAEIEKLINDYKEGISTDSSETLITPTEAIELARNILRQKKSAKVSMEKLLTSIYHQEISL